MDTPSQGWESFEFRKFWFRFRVFDSILDPNDSLLKITWDQSANYLSTAVDRLDTPAVYFRRRSLMMLQNMGEEKPTRS